MTELGHLLVAERVFQRLFVRGQWPEDLRAGMYLGAIAPDAYRVTTGLDYREIHFRSARRPGFRLTDFLRTYLRPALQDEEDLQPRAFFCGWLSHICTDYVWRQQIRNELQTLWHDVIEAPRLESVALKHQFYDECDWADIQLYRLDGENLERMRWRLSQAPICCTIPPLQTGDIQRWRQQVVEEMIPPANYTVEQPELLTLEFVREALSRAEEETLEMLAWEERQAAEALKS